MKIHVSPFFAFAFITVMSMAQVDHNSDLFIELRKQDSIFFERGFNQCDLDYLESRLNPGFRMYHDQSGFQDRAAFFYNTRKYVCAGGGKKPIRKVDIASLEVFPLHHNGKLYGAIQKGVHHFYLKEEGQDNLWTSTARFTHTWVLDEGVWKIDDVLSYDHQEQADALNNDGFDMEALLKESGVPALGIGIIENGTFNKVEVYGTLDGERKAPYNTIFKVASLTKPIFALTVLKLVDQGVIGLDEPLHPYFVDPDIKQDERHKKLTPRLILTHQSGFPNWRYLTESNTLTFEHDPGTKYQYSGEGFEYLRKAIEYKTGESIEELAEEYLFAPLGMRDTHFWWNTEMDENRYALNFNEAGEKIATQKYYEANAAANVLSTVEDYGKFLEHVINGAGLSDELFQQMISPQVQLKENDFFGLGWEILTNFSDGDHALLHTGKDPGVNTLAIWFPKSKNGYIIFANGDNVIKILEQLLLNRLYLGKDLWYNR